MPLSSVWSGWSEHSEAALFPQPALALWAKDLQESDSMLPHDQCFSLSSFIKHVK